MHYITRRLHKEAIILGPDIEDVQVIFLRGCFALCAPLSPVCVCEKKMFWNVLILVASFEEYVGVSKLKCIMCL